MFSRPRVREVTTLPSWVCCYLTFLAVGTTDPTTRDQLTYAILLVKEFLKHGGQVWLEYDGLFLQQAAVNTGLPWNVIRPSLHATTILRQRSAGSGKFCTLCEKSDHTVSQCALSQLQHQVVKEQPSTGPICSLWNDGACTYPGTCTYRHVCSKSYHRHTD